MFFIYRIISGHLIVQGHVRAFLNGVVRRRRRVVVIFALLVTFVVQSLDLVEQRLRSQVSDVGLLEHQALVVQRFEVILLVL